MLIYYKFMVITLKALISNMIIIKIFTWLKNLSQSYGIFLIYIANFIKIENHFNDWIDFHF
jgi:hypothetical protein